MVLGIFFCMNSTVIKWMATIESESSFSASEEEKKGQRDGWLDYFICSFSGFFGGNEEEVLNRIANSVANPQEASWLQRDKSQYNGTQERKQQPKTQQWMCLPRFRWW